MAKYNIYHGKFKCQECGAEVTSLRCYSETKQLTWMCSDKHVSMVNLIAQKPKKKND